MLKLRFNYTIFIVIILILICSNSLINASREIKYDSIMRNPNKGVAYLMKTDDSKRDSKANFQDKEENWEEVVVEGNISHRNYNHYMLLFKEDNFQLIGKLMTLFLVEEEKGYKIEQLEDSSEQIKRFAIQSRKTIKEGSYIDIHAMNEKKFVFTGKLLVEKLISFDCDIRVELEYIKGEDDVSYQAKVNYLAPSLVNGLNSMFSAFSGEDYISRKLLDFIDNLHLVLIELDRLDSKRWYKLAYDRDLLASLIYPVDFTYAEIIFIANMLKD